SDRLDDLANPINHRGRCFLSADHFHQRHEMRRIPEMRPRELLAATRAAADLGDTQTARRRDEYRVALRRFAESLEQLDLLLHYLADRVHHQIAALGERRQIAAQFDATILPRRGADVFVHPRADLAQLRINSGEFLEIAPP